MRFLWTLIFAALTCLPALADRASTLATEGSIVRTLVALYCPSVHLPPQVEPGDPPDSPEYAAILAEAQADLATVGQEIWGKAVQERYGMPSDSPLRSEDNDMPADR